MAFVETDFELPTRHNPYLHELVISRFKSEQRGDVLDLPAGPGYLLKDLIQMGFTGVAGEIDESLHCFNEIPYEKVDMTRPFPFEDNRFDYVVSIEGIEHIENHYQFLREIFRVLKPGGKVFLTTPNIHSLESRWNFLFSGFHELAPKPIPLDTSNIYFEHINPLSLDQLYFAFNHVGFRFDNLSTFRYRKGSLMLYYLLYPFIYYSTYKACFRKEKDLKRRKMNKELFRLLISKENQLGSHTIITAHKPVK